MARRRTLRVLLAALAILAVVALGVTLWFRANVLSIFEQASRRALEKAGLERVELDTGSGTLVYWRGGVGPPLFLIHGSGHQAGVWAATAERLTDRYRVVVPDLPGHGDSDPVDGPLPMAVIYGGLEALVSVEVDAPPAILVGNSLGGWLAMIQAHRHPQTVERVIALNGGALFNDPGDISLVPADRAQARHTVTALRDPASPQIPDYVLDDLVERSDDGPVARMLQDFPSLVAHLLDGRLGEIETPVDLVWGASDQLMKLAYAERLDTELPVSRLTTIPACGHIPHSECPERFHEILDTVLAMEPPAAAPSTTPDDSPAPNATDPVVEETR